MSAQEESQAIVIDMGTGVCKAGFAGDDAPRACFPNMVGRAKAGAVGLIGGSGSEETKLYIGEGAAKLQGVIDVRYPIEDGIVKDFEGCRALITHCCEVELRACPSDYNILLTEAPSNPQKNREFLFEVCFDDLQFKGAQVQIQAVLALYASGRTTGMVFDSGDGVSHCVPVYKGYGLRNAVTAAKCAGRVITDRVVDLLEKYHGMHLLNESNGREIARSIKEACCEVALDFEADMAAVKADPSKGKEFQFNDGQVITVKELIYEAPEVLYDPAKHGVSAYPLQEILRLSIEKCNIDTRKSMFENTVISGGTTMVKGYEQRFLKEYRNIVPAAAKESVKVIADANRYFSVWCGGSILASLDSFNSSWITKEEWEENGHSACEAKKLF